MRYIERRDYTELHPENDADVKYLHEHCGAKGAFAWWCVPHPPAKPVATFTPTPSFRRSQIPERNPAMSYDTAFRELRPAGWSEKDADETARIFIELQHAKEQEQCSEPS